tara:strand:- start:847 stop:1224 length:378 start_codon:yes stop_codon:yes gene_type:complete
MPKRYKAYTLLGLFEGSLGLILHNPFFSIFDDTRNPVALIHNIYMIINILSLASCILLLRQKLFGLKMARFSLIINIALVIIDDILSISNSIPLEYIISIIDIMIYGLFLRYWMKKEHFVFLSNS